MQYIIYNPHKNPGGRQGSIMHKLKQERGIVPCTNYADLQRLEQLALPTIEAMQDYFAESNTALVFLYEKDLQPKNSPLRTVDGINYDHFNTVTQRSVCAVGLDREVLYKDKCAEIVPAMLLHLLAHSFEGPGHGVEFTAREDYLLAEYETRTGIHLAAVVESGDGSGPSVITD